MLQVWWWGKGGGSCVVPFNRWEGVLYRTNRQLLNYQLCMSNKYSLYYLVLFIILCCWRLCQIGANSTYLLSSSLAPPVQIGLQFNIPYIQCSPYHPQVHVQLEQCGSSWAQKLSNLGSIMDYNTLPSIPPLSSLLGLHPHSHTAMALVHTLFYTWQYVKYYLR